MNLDEREYLEVIGIARRAVPPTLSFIAGAGQQSTRGTIREIEHAAAAGAEAALVITPHYYRPAMTREVLVNHYLAVADASPLPIILYSMPDLTGIKIEPETAFADALQAGASGGILAVGCVVPKLCRDIYGAVQAGRLDHATELQDRLTPLARAVTKTYGIGGLKAAMDMAGYIGGAVRAPLKRASEEACAEIQQLLYEATGTISGKGFATIAGES